MSSQDWKIIYSPWRCSLNNIDKLYQQEYFLQHGSPSTQLSNSNTSTSSLINQSTLLSIPSSTVSVTGNTQLSILSSNVSNKKLVHPSNQLLVVVKQKIVLLNITIKYHLSIPILHIPI